MTATARDRLTEAIEQTEDALSTAEGALDDARDKLYALRSLIGLFAPNGDIPEPDAPDPAAERRALATWNQIAERKQATA